MDDHFEIIFKDTGLRVTFTIAMIVPLRFVSCLVQCHHLFLTLYSLALLSVGILAGLAPTSQAAMADSSLSFDRVLVVEDSNSSTASLLR
jgi:hypothetical protein